MSGNVKPIHPLDKWEVVGVQPTAEQQRQKLIEATKLLEGATKKLKELLHS